MNRYEKDNYEYEVGLGNYLFFSLLLEAYGRFRQESAVGHDLPVLTRELGSSGPYVMLFCLDDLDKKKHRDVINSLKNPFF